MRVVRRLYPFCSAAAAVLFASSLLAASAQSGGGQEGAAKIGIKNFGSVNDFLYRGAQPKGEDYQALKAMGIKTVIDLQKGGKSDEKQHVEAAGMKFFKIPMSDSSTPSPESAEQFLSIVNNAENHPIFFHCKGGRHRTGAMAAVFRMTSDGWTADRAVAEMKAFDFDYGFGHGALKDYVYDYYTQMNKGIVVNANK
jgi:protein tyrosine/serine phosphatase